MYSIIKIEQTTSPLGVVDVTCPFTCPAGGLFFLVCVLRSFQEFFFFMLLVLTRRLRTSIAGTRNERLLCSPFSACDTTEISSQLQSRKGTLYMYVYTCMSIAKNKVETKNRRQTRRKNDTVCCCVNPLT